MSTEENKAMFRRILEEAWNKGNLSVVDELIATNFVYHAPWQDLKGPEGFKQYVTMVRTAFPDIHFTIEDMVAEGDKVVVRYTFRGTHKGDLWVSLRRVSKLQGQGLASSAPQAVRK